MAWQSGDKGIGKGRTTARSKEATHDGGKFVLGGLTKKRDMPQEIKFKLESNYFKGINCNVIVFPSVLRCALSFCAGEMVIHRVMDRATSIPGGRALSVSVPPPPLSCHHNSSPLLLRGSL